METKVVIKTHIEKLMGSRDFGLNFEQENGDYVRAEDYVDDACEYFEFSENALTAIDMALNYLVDALLDELNQDLKDIWKRLNKLEQERVD